MGAYLGGYSRDRVPPAKSISLLQPPFCKAAEHGDIGRR
jgi:hypothetical protein